MKRKRILRQLIPYLSLLPVFAIISPLLIYPLIRNVYLSFFEFGLIFPEYRFVGFNNFIEVFSEPSFWYSVRITFIFTGVAVVLEFFVGLSIALVLSKSIRGMRFYRVLITVPYLTAPVVAALMWRLIWDPDLGPINAMLEAFGITGPSWIGDPSIALFCTILTRVWRDTPFVILVLLAGLQSLPQEPYDAARIDGGSRWQIFRYITLPMLIPAILIVLLFQTIFSFRAFDIIWILTEGGPAGSTMTLSVRFYRTLFRYFQGGEAAMIALTMLFFTLLLSFVFFRVLYRKVSSS